MYLRNRIPPALVARIPPIWQLPFAPKSIGIIIPASSRHLLSTSSKIQPACARITPLVLSIESILFRRDNERITEEWNSLVLGYGTAPPTKPVLPPCGTTPILKVDIKTLTSQYNWLITSSRYRTLIFQTLQAYNSASTPQIPPPLRSSKLPDISLSSQSNTPINHPLEIGSTLRLN